MSVIILLLLASLLVAAIFLAAFLWSVRSKQYDDELAPPLRMLFDDMPATGEPSNQIPTITSNQNTEIK